MDINGIFLYVTYDVLFFLKICIIMQIIHYIMSRDFIYPITCKSYMIKNFMLLVNIYGFMRFLCNVFAWQAL